MSVESAKGGGMSVGILLACATCTPGDAPGTTSSSAAATAAEASAKQATPTASADAAPVPEASTRQAAPMASADAAPMASADAAPTASAEAAAAPIGQAAMLPDGSIVLDLYRPALLRKTYAPSDPQHADILRHVGGLKPGEQKLVPPWPDPYNADRVEAAVHAYVAKKKGWRRDEYEVRIDGNRKDEVIVTVVHADDRKARAPGGGKSIKVDVAIATYSVVRELAFQ